jgi:gliding motility-associated-like protein
MTGIVTPRFSVATPFPDGRRSARHQYIIRASDLRMAGMHSGTLSGLAFQFFPNSGGMEMKSVRLSLMCVDIDNFDGAPGFLQGATEVFYSAAVQIPASGGFLWLPFSVFYNRDTGKNLLVDICYDNGVPLPTVQTAFTEMSYNATQYDTAGGAGNLCTGAGSQPGSSREMPIVRFSYHLAPEGNWSPVWTSGGAVVGQGAYPELLLNEGGRLQARIQNRNGCLLTDTVEVQMPDSRLLSEDTSLCLGESVALQAINGAHYQWYGTGYQPATGLNCVTCPNPVATPAQDEEYIVVIDDLGCYDTFSVSVQVTPYPELAVTPTSVVTPYGTPVRLQASGAESYTWSPGAGLDNPFSGQPIAQPEKTTQYTVTGYYDREPRCQTTTTVMVEVDQREPLWVPTAFTPNGDGRNDVFRLGNFYMQKVMEFRVFNRWGEELFSGSDNAGWDGTWKGVPQEVGTYYYRIQVELRDGSLKTFKGDVTLIR